jgi:hypothetical protein
MPGVHGIWKDLCVLLIVGTRASNALDALGVSDAQGDVSDVLGVSDNSVDSVTYNRPLGYFSLAV